MGHDITTGLMQTVWHLEFFKGLEPHSFIHLMTATNYSREVIADWRPRFILLRDILIFIWTVSAINWILLRGLLNQLCAPRSSYGLFGLVFVSPLLHGDMEHLVWNSLYLFVFGWLILLRGIPDFIIVTAVSALVTGIGVWLFSNRPTIGASGIVYGYFSFLLFSGFFDRDLISLILTIVVLIIDWVAIRQLFVVRPGISTEGHMFGFFGGILAILWLPTLKEAFF